MKYTLKKKKTKELNKFVVTYEADINDSDYITVIETYSKKEFEEWVIDELISLKNQYTGDLKLEDYNGRLDIPANDFGDSAHTLGEVKVDYIDENGEIWTVEY